MNGLTIENRTITANTSLSLDLAKHLAERLAFGGEAAIVSKQPAALLASTRKQWLRVLRQAERARASTIDMLQLVKLKDKIARMQQADFAAGVPITGAVLEDITANVLFATAEQFCQVPPMCPTMYVVTPTEKEMLYRITAFMPPKALVVIYGLDPEWRKSIATGPA